MKVYIPKHKFYYKLCFHYDTLKKTARKQVIEKVRFDLIRKIAKTYSIYIHDQTLATSINDGRGEAVY